ncbi:hypothetical protein T484DRAFT_1799377, partial [Baffinella frigidus]
MRKACAALTLLAVVEDENRRHFLLLSLSGKSSLARAAIAVAAVEDENRWPTSHVLPGQELAAVEDENRKLKASLSRAEARIVELEEQLQKVQKTSRDQYEQAVGALQKQVVSLQEQWKVVSLQEQWKVTQRQDKDEYEAEIRRLQ